MTAHPPIPDTQILTSPLPPGTLLLIRHAKAAGQAPDAPLTDEGKEQARRLADTLAPLGVTRLTSSPWTRAVDTIRPLAERLRLEMARDDRLTERVLSGRDLPEWPVALRASFEDDTLALPGGESGAAARRRGQAALEAARDPAGAGAAVTHGNLLALLLGLDYGGWAALGNPDVWVWEPHTTPRRLAL